jgi:tripartite-type tricarboxylate transporter receptor subunit TctC
VPLKGGGAEMANSLAIGDTQVGFVNAASAEGLVKAGKLTPLAALGDKRLDSYPDVPTMTEVGFPGVGTILWNGIFIHADTPQPIVDRLYKEIATAMMSDESAKVFKTTGTMVTLSGSPAKGEEWQLGQIKKWQQITNEVHIQLE